MNERLVSVVLPTYNRCTELINSIRSILNQTYKELELIIVDDASVDNTESIVSGLKDSRIRYIRNTINVGAAESRNIGIRSALGKWVAFQDSDDEWLPFKLERCLEVLINNPAVSGVYSGFWRIVEGERQYWPLTLPPNKSNRLYHSLLWRNYVDTPTAVVERVVLNKINGFDSTMPRYQDWELFIRIAKNHRMLFIRDPLVLSYYSNTGISANKKRGLKALKIIYSKNKNEIIKNRTLNAYWMHYLGDEESSYGNFIKGQKKMLDAVKYDPLNLRYIVKLMLSVLCRSNIQYILLKQHLRKLC